MGTHMDAPFHFNPKGWTTDKIPLEVEANIFHGCRQMIFDHSLGSDVINNQISRKLSSQSMPKNIQFVIKVLIDVPGVLVDISDKASKDPQVKKLLSL